ncbi:histone-lysine N-methyltransferase SETMAR [Trichonephila clavipes]|nr:histone-lysine N-methyltransferase SETMAR [Trichonephila clavipes]
MWRIPLPKVETDGATCYTAEGREVVKVSRRLRTIGMSELGLSYGSVQRIVPDVLLYSKVSTRWVLRELFDEQKATRMIYSLTFLQRYHFDGQLFFDHIVTGDEASPFRPHKQKKHPWSGNTLEHQRKKFKVTLGAGKVMATTYSGIHAVLSCLITWSVARPSMQIVVVPL